VAGSVEVDGVIEEGFPVRRAQPGKRLEAIDQRDVLLPRQLSSRLHVPPGPLPVLRVPQRLEQEDHAEGVLLSQVEKRLQVALELLRGDALDLILLGGGVIEVGL